MTNLLSVRRCESLGIRFCRGMYILLAAEVERLFFFFLCDRLSFMSYMQVC